MKNSRRGGLAESKAIQSQVVRFPLSFSNNEIIFLKIFLHFLG